MIAHSNPIEEQETMAYKQNGWVLLCLGILLVPMWLLGLDLLMGDLTFGEPHILYIVIFVAASVLLALVFLAVSFAFQARRPGIQVMAALLIVVTVNVGNLLVWAVMVGLFIIFLTLWAKGGGSRSPSDPTYLPVMSGLAILSVILAFTWTLGSTMGMPFQRAGIGEPLLSFQFYCQVRGEHAEGTETVHIGKQHPCGLAAGVVVNPSLRGGGGVG